MPHSLQFCPGTFISSDHVAAENFRSVSDAAGVARIIYFGALGETQADFSSQLKSRMQVVQVLRSGSARGMNAEKEKNSTTVGRKPEDWKSVPKAWIRAKAPL